MNIFWGRVRCWPAPLAASLLVAAAVAFACAQPLTPMLGYESAALFQIVFALAAPAVGLSAHAHTTSAGRAARAAYLILGSLFLLAMGCIWLSGRIVGHCNDVTGAQFWLLLPAVSVVYGGACGLLMGRLRPLRRQRACRVGASMAIPALFAGGIVWRLYHEPPVRVFDPLFGFFAGSLYDEHVALSFVLVRFRLVCLVLAAAMLCAALSTRRTAAFVHSMLFVCFALHAAVVWWGPTLGIRLSASALQQRYLPIALTRPGLVVHLPREMPSSLRERIADDHAFRLAQLERHVPQPRATQPIHSYMFASREDKARVLGLEDTQLSRPWRREIYLDGPASPHPLLAHELAHVALAPYARGPLSIAAAYRLWPNMPMTEGMAVMLAPDTQPLGLIPTACAMRRLHVGAALQDLLDPHPVHATRAFWGESPERAYTLVGALLTDLRERFGMRPLLDAYRDADLSRALQTSVTAIEQEFWQRHDQAPPAPQEREQVRSDMRRASIFVRRCPHEVQAILREKPPATIDERIARAARLYDVSGHAFDAGLRLLEVLREGTQSRPRYQACEAAWLGRTPRNVYEQATQLSYRAARKADDNQILAARHLYDEALQLPVAEGQQRNLLLERALLLLPSAARMAVRAALQHHQDDQEGESVFERLSQHPDATLSAFGHALMAQLSAARFSPAQAQQHWAAATPLPSAAWQRARFMGLATQAWLLGDAKQMRDAVEGITPVIKSAAHRAWQSDWRERVHFLEAHNAP